MPKQIKAAFSVENPFRSKALVYVYIKVNSFIIYSYKKSLSFSLGIYKNQNTSKLNCFTIRKWKEKIYFFKAF